MTEATTPLTRADILDRFHMVAKLNKALDEVRAGEARRMLREGYEPLLTLDWDGSTAGLERAAQRAIAAGQGAISFTAEGRS